MILIYPPVAKPCEPPPGVARLLGALNAHGIQSRVLDANLEGILHLLHRPKTSFDTWTNRAFRNRSDYLASLRARDIYSHPAHYRRAVSDINRILESSWDKKKVILSLSNYRHNGLSPVNSSDLRRAAESPEENPFYPYFKGRLGSLLESAR